MKLLSLIYFIIVGCMFIALIPLGLLALIKLAIFTILM